MLNRQSIPTGLIKANELGGDDS